MEVDGGGFVDHDLGRLPYAPSNLRESRHAPSEPNRNRDIRYRHLDGRLLVLRPTHMDHPQSTLPGRCYPPAMRISQYCRPPHSVLRLYNILHLHVEDAHPPSCHCSRVEHHNLCQLTSPLSPPYLQDPLSSSTQQCQQHSSSHLDLSIAHKFRQPGNTLRAINLGAHGIPTPLRLPTPRLLRELHPKHVPYFRPQQYQQRRRARVQHRRSKLRPAQHLGRGNATPANAHAAPGKRTTRAAAATEYFPHRLARSGPRRRRYACSWLLCTRRGDCFLRWWSWHWWLLAHTSASSAATAATEHWQAMARCAEALGRCVERCG